MLDELKTAVLNANQALVRRGLVLGTWGNASAMDRSSGLLVIKPSGVAYDALTADRMVVVDLEGRVIEGGDRPSSDTATHIELYKAFPAIGGVVHTHSHFATCWAQACRPIPCLGTTQADYFCGEVPVTRPLTPEEIATHYERNTGLVIARCFEDLDPVKLPGVLAANHGPFVWAPTIEQAVENAVVLEEVARMALHTLLLSPKQGPIVSALLEKHFYRKHGAGAYYGQVPEG